MYDIFSDFFDDFGGFDVFMNPSPRQEEKRCPLCGHTYSDFRRTGKIGCGECYKVFRAPIKETLRRIQPAAEHRGKIPSKSGEELKLKRRYASLKQEISAAVKNEDYEKAAKIHKEIQEIEKEMKKS